MKNTLLLLPKFTNVRDRVIELVNVLKYVSECMGIQYKFHAYLKHGLLLFCNPAPHSNVITLDDMVIQLYNCKNHRSKWRSDKFRCLDV